MFLFTFAFILYTSKPRERIPLLVTVVVVSYYHLTSLDEEVQACFASVSHSCPSLLMLCSFVEFCSCKSLNKCVCEFACASLWLPPLFFFSWWCSCEGFDFRREIKQIRLVLMKFPPMQKSPACFYHIGLLLLKPRDDEEHHRWRCLW